MNGKFLSKHQHLFLTIGSFLAVYLVYLLYAYVLCPFEPVRPNRIVMKETPSSKREEIAGYLEQLFSPDDWRCKMENFFFTKGENCLLLFRSEPVLSQYQISADACTLIFLSNEYESIQERYRHAFIMETNDPIVLSFSRELSLEMLGMFDFADFEKGEFKGQVILRCKMESDGNEDEFFLSTRNIIFDTKQIRTREPVSFRLGKNLGEGEDLTIDIQLPLTVYQSEDLITDENRTLTPAEQIRRIVNNGNLGSGISLQRIELAKIKKFDFQPDLSGLKSSKETLSGKKDEPHSESRGPDGNFPTDVFAADSREKKETLPISITCENGVYFAPNPENPAGWIARFMENVEVVIYHEDEEQDTLNCKNLYLYLVDPELEQLAQETSNFRNIHLKKTPSGRLSVLQPVIVRAIRSEKSPLKISFPRFEFLALQDELIYDIRKKYLSLMAESKEEPIRLQKGTMTLTATKILYGPDANPASTMGTVYVENGGSLESLLPKTEDKYLRIFWEKGLQVFLEPSDLSLVHLMMTGQVTFKADGMATITAEGADFWGRLPNRNDAGSAQREPADPSEAPVFRQAGYNSSVPEVNENKIAGQLSAITPESIVFQKNIVLDSPQGKGNIKNKLTVRIDTQNNQKKEAASTHPPVVPHTSPISEESLKKTFFDFESTENGDPKMAFDLTAQTLDLWCHYQTDDNKNKIDIAKILVQGNVLLKGTSGGQADKPFHILGDSVLIEEPTTERTRIILNGENASFMGGGLQLNGNYIKIDRQQNTFAVDGPGKLNIILKDILQAQGKPWNAENSQNAASDQAQDSSNPPSPESDLLMKNGFANFFSSDPIEIQWSKKMTFDGLTLDFLASDNTSGMPATFRDRVRIQQRTQTISCQEVRLTLKQPISLFDIQTSQEPNEMDVEWFFCQGNYDNPVEVEFVEIGKPTGNRAGAGDYYRVSFENFLLQRSSGNFTAKGPGRIQAILASERFNQKQETLSTNSPIPPVEIKDKSSLLNQEDMTILPWIHFSSTFQESLTGNIYNREMTAHRQIQTAFCSTDSRETALDVNNSDTFPENTAYMFCQQLQMNLVPTGSHNNESESSFELNASQNVFFRHKKLSGRCGAIKYSDSKKSILLTGTGTNKVVLQTQEQPGVPSQSLGACSRASYNLLTEKIDIEDYMF